MSWFKFKSDRDGPASESTTHDSSISLPAAGRFGRFKSKASALIHPRKKFREIFDITKTSNEDGFGSDTPLEDEDRAISELVGEPAAEVPETDTAPISKGSSSKTVIWNTFRTALDVANEAADGIPPVGLKAAIGGLIAVIKTFEAAEENLEDLGALSGHIGNLQKTVIGPLRTLPREVNPHETEFLTNVASALERELDSLATAAKERMKQSKFKRTVGSTSDAGAIRQMNQDLDRALAKFQAGTIVDIANQLEQDAQRDLIAASLPRVYEAGYNSGLRNISGSARCLPGTQEATLANIRAWLTDLSPGSLPVFWIWGMAGTGKSTIAQTIAEEEASQNHLGASFFFSRDYQQQRNALLLFSSIAVQLSEFNSAYKRHLAKAIKTSPGSGHAPIYDQFTTLLANPLLACGSLSYPIVIVIDALDECDPESGAETIIETLATSVKSLGQRVKILVTSRPEQWLRAKLRSTSIGPPSSNFKLYEINDDVLSRDIERYLSHHLRRIASKHELPASWPDQKQMDILVKKAGTLFIVASTLIKFIDDKHSNPVTELDVLTKDNVTAVLGPEDALISMYTAVINRALPERTSPKSLRVAERVKTIVGAIVLVKDPMSQDTLAAFLRPTSGDESVSAALTRLHSLLIVPDASQNGTAFTRKPIRVLHQSFPEYLTNPLQCEPRLYIDPIKGHAQLAALCLTHLMSLKTNPCNIDNLACPNDEVKNLPKRINDHLPIHVRYSCLYFVDHIAASSPHNGESLLMTFAEFCKSKLLVWIEVLSYLDRLEIAGDALRNLQSWYTDTPNPLNHIKEVMNDAQRLLHRFFDLIRLGAGQVYLTALPCSSPCTLWSQYEVFYLELQLPQHPTRDNTLSYLANQLKRVCDSFLKIGAPRGSPLQSLDHRYQMDLERSRSKLAAGYLTEAIGLYRETLGLRPSDHILHEAAAVDLAICLRDLYGVTGSPDAIEEAIGLHRATLERRPLGHPLRDEALSTLAFCLTDRYKQSSDVSDLMAAIELLQEAVELRPFGHPKRAETLSNLATCKSLQCDLFEPQYCASHDATTDSGVRQVVDMVREATLPSLAPIADRVDAAKLWMELARKHQDPSEIEAARVALDLLDFATSISPDGLSSRYTEDEYASLAQEVASDAAALAIECGDIKLAVCLLEQGQSCTFVGRMRHRCAIDEVREASQDLAERLVQLSTELNVLVADPECQDGPAHATRFIRYSQVHSDWITTVADIRKLPGLELFMLPNPFHQLQLAAERGPVVIFNINKLRSDAIVIVSSGDPVLVPLTTHPDLVPQFVRSLRSWQSGDSCDLTRSLHVFRQLWRGMVAPVVERLHDYPTGSRIWLCPIGKASMLPLHAAGNYVRGGTGLRKHFVPSYTPSLGALIRARRSTIPHPQAEDYVRSTAAINTCRHGAEELEAIQQLTPNVSILQPSEATGEAVLKEIQEHPWLYLSGCTIPISSLDLQPKDVPGVELTVLSVAYGTGTNMEQSLRFIARMMWAGFTNIIGPMWPGYDGLAIEVTTGFYKLMLDSKHSGTDTPIVLAQAFKETSAAEVTPDRFMAIVNFVHYGV